MDHNHVVKIGVSTPIPAVDGPAGRRLGMVTTEWHRARMSMVGAFGFNTMDLACDGDEVGVARNKIAARCLELGLDFLFFLDWDVLIPPMTLHRLVVDAANHPDIDVFSGVYCVKMDPPAPLIYKGWGVGPFWDWTPGEKLVDGITGCGMGCALIRTSIFKRLPHSDEKPWFKTMKELDGNAVVHMTEDLWFTKRITEELGAKIMIDTGILCNHIDPATGCQYALPPDSLPMRRMNAQ